jgi:hypothetical protein
MVRSLGDGIRNLVLMNCAVKQESKHRLLQATFRAYLLPFISAVIPRLCLSAFKFCQPLLISATLSFVSSPSTPENQIYGPALVGAYVLTYLGMAVWFSCTKSVYRQLTIYPDIKCSILASSIPPHHHVSRRPDSFDISPDDKAPLR